MNNFDFSDGPKKIVMAIIGVLVFIFVAFNVSYHLSQSAEAKREADKGMHQMRAVEEQQRLLDDMRSPGF